MESANVTGNTLRSSAAGSSGSGASDGKISKADLAKLSSLDTSNDEYLQLLSGFEKLSSTDQLAVQQAVEQRSTALQMLTNIMKKLFDTAQNIAANFR